LEEDKSLAERKSIRFGIIRAGCEARGWNLYALFGRNGKMVFRGAAFQ
jgi:hypothetical protein